MIDKAHHHLAHVDEVLSRHLIIVHCCSLHLSVDLIGEVLSLFSQTLNLFRSVWQNVLESLGRISLDLLGSDLIFIVYPPCDNVLLLEKFLLLLQELLVPSLKFDFGFFLQTLSLTEGNRFLAMVLKPRIQLVVQELT